jgi:anti-sigma-K factor RskA
MIGFDDTDALAAEYVLGTLEFAERAEVAARRMREPALDQAIRDWEFRLGPLTEAIPAIEPPPGILPAVQRRLDSPQDSGADLARRLRRWRSAAIGLGALAACLAVGFGLRETAFRAQPRTFVAILQKDPASPGFLVSVDLDTRSLTVRPVAAQAQPGKSYELWLVGDGGAPKSLGLVDQPVAHRPTLARYDPATVENATYAVSLEPQGGSPTGAPTGPVVFSGRLIQATP